MDKENYSEIHYENIILRGENYLKDRKKIESQPPILKLHNLTIIDNENYNEVKSNYQNYLREGYFNLLVNIKLYKKHYLCVFYGSDDDIKKSDLIREFVDDYLDQKQYFKILPSIITENKILKKIIKKRPVIIGKKTKVLFNKMDSYFEIYIDLLNSFTIRAAFSLVSKYISEMIIDLGFIIEGKIEQDLPEKLLCGIRFINFKL